MEGVTFLGSRAFRAFAVFIALFAASGSASATLIVNGQFDTDLSGWTWSATGSVSPGAQWNSEDGGEAWLGVTGTPGTATLKQSFSVGSSDAIAVTFDYSLEGQDSQDPPDEFTASILYTDTSNVVQTATLLTLLGTGSTVAGSFSGLASFAHIDITKQVELVFHLIEQDNSQTSGGTRVELDNVVVAVPEPTTLGIVGCALLGLLTMRRKRISA